MVVRKKAMEVAINNKDKLWSYVKGEREVVNPTVRAMVGCKIDGK